IQRSSASRNCNKMQVQAEELFSSLPAQQDFRHSPIPPDRNERFVVLDDDPTGTQTVHSVPVLTTFNDDAIREVLRSNSVTYVLTNARSLDEKEAVALASE